MWRLPSRSSCLAIKPSAHLRRLGSTSSHRCGSFLRRGLSASCLCLERAPSFILVIQPLFPIAHPPSFLTLTFIVFQDTELFRALLPRDQRRTPSSSYLPAAVPSRWSTLRHSSSADPSCGVSTMIRLCSILERTHGLPIIHRPIHRRLCCRGGTPLFEYTVHDSFIHSLSL